MGTATLQGTLPNVHRQSRATKDRVGDLLPLACGKTPFKSMTLLSRRESAHCPSVQVTAGLVLQTEKRVWVVQDPTLYLQNVNK